jgi:chromate transporter
LLVGVIAWAYVRFGGLPELAGVLYGIKPVVIGVVVQALWGLAPKAIKKSFVLGFIGFAAAAASAFGVDAIIVLVVAGLAAMLARRADGKNALHFLGPAAGAVASGAVIAPVSLLTLFFTFLKIGAVVFGSGYVLLAFLRADLVDRLHWLKEPELIDAVAVGQLTPGPVFTTATFIGYLVGGVRGAIVATVGIFLPGFCLVALTRPLVARIRRSTVASAFLDGVNVASLALMAVVTVQLGKAALVDLPTVLIAALGALLLIRYKVSSTWLVLGAALLGVLRARLLP